MKVIKRMISILLAIVIILPVFSDVVNASNPNSQYIFTEEFDGTNTDLQNKGWDIATDVTLQNGQLLIDNNTSMYLIGSSSAANWKAWPTYSNYIYEADVVMTDTVTSKANDKIVTIIAGASSTKVGYEFALVYRSASQKYSCWLRNYTDSSKPVLAQPQCDFSLNETVHLKMVVEDNTIQCYVNDALMISETVGTEAITGTIGVRANGYAGIFDNIRVSAIDPIEIEEETEDVVKDEAKDKNVSNDEKSFSDYQILLIVGANMVLLFVIGIAGGITICKKKQQKRSPEGGK